MEKTTRRLPIVERDEWLLPAEQELNRRYERYTDKINAIEQAAGSIVDYANGYRYFGWQRDEVLDGWWLREWLPGAHDVYVFGDFNNWQRTEIRMHKDAAGVWSAFFPAAMYRDRLRHGSLYKIHVHGDNGWLDRIPAYATRVVQDEATKNYTAQFWAPEPFDWRGDAFDASKIGSLLIYEAHVGMAQEKEGVGTYREFTEKILPIIKKDGYNAVQLMAIAEHPYYGSFGYHVSSFFAPASRCGTPEELKELVNSDETLNHTFTKFRELQQRWKETGIVPLQNVKDLWETYNLHVENFYSFIKINKELRDLDLKKNYEQKVALCEQAEALVLEPSVVEAFHKLQKLHDEWRETGPVANEYKEVLWERFKAASSRINKQHQEHFEALKGEQVRNLELKTELCAATEELAAQPLTTRKEWNRASDRLLEIQKTWKTIGFAPKKDNNRIYERFRTACDRFFEAKRQFYAGVKAEMEHNLQLKTEICEAAESLMNSEEWKKATDELIALQARWKEIGAVSRRHSDAIWKRFRAACDKFFERKASHFASVDGEYEENLRQKLALLDEMAAADVKAGGYDVIREFQRRWGEIGFVPIKQKDAGQKKYKAAVDALFNTLRGSERDRSMNRFREKVSTLKSAGSNRLRSERERLYNKVRQLEQEIGLLENNIGFFAKSKNAEALIADVKAKIERAREDMAAAIEKVKLIDRQAQEENHENNDNK